MEAGARSGAGLEAAATVLADAGLFFDELRAVGAFDVRLGGDDVCARYRVGRIPLARKCSNKYEREDPEERSEDQPSERASPLAAGNDGGACGADQPENSDFHHCAFWR